MSRRLGVIFAGLLVVAALAVALTGTVLAQEDTTTSTLTSHGGLGWGRGLGCGLCGEAGLQAAAEALGMTADELSTQLWGGRTLADLADQVGVDLQAVRDAVEAACEQATRDAIEQAVEDGRLTREQADWLLEGLEQGYLPGRFGYGRGFGHGFGRMGMMRSNGAMFSNTLAA